jgi:hypothetical protein
MSTFGWSPNDHRDELPQFSPNPDGVKPIQDTSLEEYVARFHQSQEHEDAMKDTEPIGLLRFSEEQQVQRVMTIVASRIGVRVEDLADWNATAKKLASERDEISANAEALLERLEHIAAVLKTFYFAELSMSSVQPILALALEFNPDIVEQRR